MGRCSRASENNCPICHNCPIRLPHEKWGPSARLREYGLSPSCFENSPSRMFFYVKLYPQMLDIAVWGLYLCGVVFHHRFYSLFPRLVILSNCHPERSEGSECIHSKSPFIRGRAAQRSLSVLAAAYHTPLAPLQRGSIYTPTHNS